MPVSPLFSKNSPAYWKLLLSVLEAVIQNVPKLNSYLSFSFLENFSLYPTLGNGIVVHPVVQARNLRVYSSFPPSLPMTALKILYL